MRHAPSGTTVRRLVLGLAGLMLLAAAALAARPALDHMQAAGAICGQAALAHCGWCYAALALALAGLASLAASARPALARQRA